VDAAQHDAFFLWAGVKAPEVLAKARTIYLLDGEVRAGPHGSCRCGRRCRTSATPRSGWWSGSNGWTGRNRSGGGCWPILTGGRRRATGWPGCNSISMRARAARSLRRVPRRSAAAAARRYKLSITGLMDWSAGGDPAALAALGSVVDDVVLQTYQGRRTVPGTKPISARWRACPSPIGWAGGRRRMARAARTGARSPFRGYVVFLLPR
jgi:hypothetical protein